MTTQEVDFNMVYCICVGKIKGKSVHIVHFKGVHTHTTHVHTCTHSTHACTQHTHTPHMHAHMIKYTVHVVPKQIYVGFGTVFQNSVSLLLG